MKIETLREFLVIAKFRSYSKAAKALYISQPTLSNHISSMEKELGFSLFDRGEGRFSLTLAGRAFLEGAQSIVTTYDDTVEEGRAFLKKMAPIRMHLPNKDSKFFKKIAMLDSIEVQFIDVDYTIPLYSALEEGLIDVCISPKFEVFSLTSPIGKEANIKFIESEPLRAAIAMDSSHPLAQKEALTKADLVGMVISIGGQAYFDEWKMTIQNTFGRDAGLKFRLNAVESTTELAREPLKDAVHICEIEITEQYYSHRGNMVYFDKVDGEEIRIPSGILYRDDCPNNQIEEFVDVLQQLQRELSH